MRSMLHTLRGVRFLFVVALCFTAFSSKAQIQIGSAEIATMNQAGSLKKSDFEDLKSTTTVFVVQTQDADRIKDFERAIAQVWTYTPFKVILPHDRGKYRGYDYSFFSFGGYMVQDQRSGGMLMHISYDLWAPKFLRSGEERGRQLFARFLLSPDEKTMRESARVGTRNSTKKATDHISTMLYTTARFDNWGPGLIKGYLKVINDQLMAQERQGTYTENNDPQLLQQLVRDTLFVPNYVNDTYSPFTGQSTLADEPDEGDVANAYPYPIKYITSAQLDRMLVERTTPFFYLMYIRATADKFVNVFEGVSGRPAYANRTGLSYNFKKKDLEKIAKRIRK